MFRSLSIFLTLLMGLLILGVHPVAASEETAIRVMTLNLHNAKDPSSQNNIERFTALLQEHIPDLVGLQEVQPAQLKNLGITGYQWVAGPNANLLTYRFGNALLVRGTIIYHRHHYLPGRLEQRGLDEVGVEIGGRQFVVFNTHLGLGKEERKGQLEAIRILIEKTPYPIILLGDFNTSPDDPAFTGVRHHLQEAGVKLGLGPTYPTAAPRHALDQIWLSQQYRPINARVLPWDGSDHLPVFAELSLDAQASHPIAIPPIIPPDLRSFSPYRNARDTEARIGVSVEPDGDNKMEGAISIPLSQQAFVHGAYAGDQIIASLGWATNPFDLRDYMSLARIQGTGQWNLLASWSHDYNPWLVWEQNYQWTPRWFTRIGVETGGPNAAWEIQQTYVLAEKVSSFVTVNGDDRITLGLNVNSGPHQQLSIAYEKQDGHDQWLFSWSVR